MNKVLFSVTFLLLALSAQSQNQHPDKSANDDHMALFGNCATSKESLVCFSEWFVDAYRHERRNYAKHNKETIKTENCEFAKAIVLQFYVDTLGHPQFLSTIPDNLCPMQTEVLQQTLKRSPAWTPAVQRGRKVKIKYSLPVRDRYPSTR